VRARTLDDLTGRTALVTGGTRGIGKETARALARLGATVVVVGRNQAGGAAAARELSEFTGNPEVIFLRADLSSRAEVRRLAQEVVDGFGRLHVLVNNAAVVSARRWETVDGVEGTLAVAHLAPFLLTELLLPTLRASAPSRIVNVSSGVIRHAELGLEDLQSVREYKPLIAYGRSKLMNLVWSLDLARRLEGTGVSVFVVDPGVADTGTHRDYPWPIPAKVIMVLAGPLLHRLLTPDKAALSSIHAASASALEGRSGLLLDRKGRPIEPPESVRGTDVARIVDRVSRELSGLSVPPRTEARDPGA
jgi:retinol dehydrogenase-14